MANIADGWVTHLSGRHKNLEEQECQQQLPTRGRSLWTPDNSNPAQKQSKAQRAYVEDDMGVHRLPGQTFDSEYEDPPRLRTSRNRVRAPASKSVNSDHQSSMERVAQDGTEDKYTVPERPPNMVRHPGTKPISQDELVAEVKGIYAGLTMIETKCIEIDKAQSSNIYINKCLSPWEWDEIIAFYCELSNDTYHISPAPRPQMYDPRTILSEYAARAKNACFLNNRLLPLLRRVKDTLSSRQLLEYSSLIANLTNMLEKSSLLDDTDILLMGVLDSITIIIKRLNIRFKRKYEELKHKNNSSQIIFEFPNNIRHVCTTMPWTILPALLVLWGVCWMFIIGPGDLEPERLNAPVPTFSPVPAGYDFYDGPAASYGDEFQAFSIADISTVAHENQLNLDELLYSGVGTTNHQLDPIHFVQATPQDPDFLARDFQRRTSAEDTEWSEKETWDLTGVLPATVTLDPILQTYDDTNCHGPPDPAVNVALVGHRNRDDSRCQEAKAHFECPDCQQTFARRSTLGRHRRQACKSASSSSEQSFPCPNPQCKHSAGRSPFKRLEHLKRHLKTSGHKQNVATSAAEAEEQPLAQPTSEPVLSHELQPQETVTEELVSDSQVKKRSRSESDDELSNESFKREMIKRRNRIAKDVQEKINALRQAEEELKLVDKAIQIWESSFQEP
ncbi:hypothetical protein BKA60DRAFT_660589 [Fusarium oxysporum]|nr:hypothetical protein BKA60DRAFT_660589 [Fusarium oxysporum]